MTIIKANVPTITNKQTQVWKPAKLLCEGISLHTSYILPTFPQGDGNTCMHNTHCQTKNDHGIGTPLEGIWK